MKFIVFDFPIEANKFPWDLIMLLFLLQLRQLSLYQNIKIAVDLSFFHLWLKIALAFMRRRQVLFWNWAAHQVCHFWLFCNITRYGHKRNEMKMNWNKKKEEFMAVLNKTKERKKQKKKLKFLIKNQNFCCWNRN